MNKDRSGLATGLTDSVGAPPACTEDYSKEPKSCRGWIIAEYALGHLILSLASFIMAFRFVHAENPLVAIDRRYVDSMMHGRNCLSLSLWVLYGFLPMPPL